MKKTILLPFVLQACVIAYAQGDTMITEPKGAVRTYDLATDQIVSQQTYSASGIKSYIAYSDDGNIAYFKEISPYFHTGVWVVGDVKGDSIFIKSGQKVHHQDETENRMAIDAYLYSGTLKGSSIEPDNEAYIKMKMNQDGTICMPKEKGIVAMDQYGDILCRNTAYIYRPFDIATDSIIPPADVADKEYCLNYKDYLGNEIYKLIKVKRSTNNDIYIQGFATRYNPDSWIKGRLEDNTAIFPSRQYQGLDGQTGEFLEFIYAGTKNFDSDFGFNLEDNLIFSYDKTRDEFYSGQSVLETLGERILIANYDQPSLKPYTPHAGKPAAPQMVYFSDYSFGTSGFLKISFNISPIDENEDYIDPTCITWRMLVNGKPYTFKKETYSFLSDDKETFNWGEQDKVDIVFEACGLYTIWFYDYSTASNISVECTYTFNGESYTTTSEPMQVSAAANISQAGINGKKVAHAEYYDLQGRQTTKPSGGIYLKTVTYTDGSKTTMKLSDN